MLTNLPELAPGIIGGAFAGMALGFWVDYTEGTDDPIPLTWWQTGGLGAVVGSLLWAAYLAWA